MRNKFKYTKEKGQENDERKDDEREDGEKDNGEKENDVEEKGRHAHGSGMFDDAFDGGRDGLRQ